MIKRVLIKRSHFYIIRIQESKRKATVRKFDEGTLLHEIKKSSFPWISG